MTDPSATSPPASHGLVLEALLYRGEAELAGTVRAFIDEAVAAAEPILLALPGEHLDQFRGLPGAIPPLTCEDMREAGRNPHRLLPLMEGWIAAHSHPGGAWGDRRVRIVSEPVWPGRSYPEAAECLRSEALLNDVLADAPVTLLCPYDAALDLDAIWPLERPAPPVHEHDLGSGLQELRRAVAGDPFVGALSADRRSDLVLAVNEAATNAVGHGDGGCSARIWHDAGGLVTEITLDGTVPDPLAARRSRPDPAADAGRGLWLINQVCDLVEMRSGDAGTTLRLHMHDNPGL